MTVELARLAAESVLGAEVGIPKRFASGRSCDAYVIEQPGNGGGHYVVRVPVLGTDRSIRFRAEAALGQLLADRGHPVARWSVIDIDGTECAVGQRLTGHPIRYGTSWTPAFTARLSKLLADLHQLPAAGFGPLIDSSPAWEGNSCSATQGVLRRWDRARCWPFDGSDLGDHVVWPLMPHEAATIAAMKQQILDAADGPSGVVHSDLHHEHLLTDTQGNLTGVLDFGDAFIGSLGWDFALLHWYYGAGVSQAVARRHPHGMMADRCGRVLALAVGLYKLSKTPTDPLIPRKLQRVVHNRRN